MTTNQDPKYVAERDKLAECSYADAKKHPVEVLKDMSDWATDYWSKRMVPGEIHNKRLEELGEYITKYEELKKVVEKLVEALKYYADERQNERQINVCEFNVNLNRMYVCGDGSRAREALAVWDEWKGKMK